MGLATAPSGCPKCLPHGSIEDIILEPQGFVAMGMGTPYGAADDNLFRSQETVFSELWLKKSLASLLAKCSSQGLCKAGL